MFKITIILFFTFIFFNAYSFEQFNFDITEVQITEDGNKFIGSKRGTIKSDSGIIIDADQFEYNKELNILNASGNVKVKDTVNSYIIYTENVIYDKKKELIYTKKNSKGLSLKDNIIITAKDFEYNKSLNIISAEGRVSIIDKINNYKINSEFISYVREEEKIYTKGKTTAIIHSRYNIKSEDVLFLNNENKELISKKNTIITDNLNLYNLSKFRYLINKEKLIGENIMISSNYKLPKNDKIYFSSGIINLKTKDFIAKDTEIKIHKNIFDVSDNDPRLKGVSSSKNGNITIINKGVFTSCKENDDCPPWSVQASEIEHDKEKKQLNYKNAFIKLYDIPVLYFPKFFHPDPSVKRQSGLLKPVLNNSNVLGSSFAIPYYKVISNDSDLTLAPTLFDSDIKMVQNEYRKIGKNYELIANFGHTREYDSTLLNKKKNISYLFSKFTADLDLEDFNSSQIFFDVEKVNNDTFLKVFNSNLLNDTTSLRPENQDKLSNELKLTLEHSDFNLTTGIQSFEDLQLINNDRYEYILPYYNFNKNLFTNFDSGSFYFQSNGSNKLNNTNQLKSQIINDLTYSSFSQVSSHGLRNNFNFKIKNLNSTGNNISEYKSSPQVELSSILEFNSSIPLKKEGKDEVSFLTPKLSLRINPSDMKNYNTEERTINASNIFSLDRLGLDDSLESGRSLTFGINYRKEKLRDVNKYFEVKLSSVLRDKEENFIPKNTTLNKKTSNIFGSLSNNLSENFRIDYNFALDNNLDEIKYNDISTTLSVNNFLTSFHFIKEIDEMGDENLIENSTSYSIDDNNYLVFNTRRNRKLNLTEFYDLIYEYKNDCLTAGIKYKKTYYEDRDLKPTEDLFFSITLFPLTTIEQKVDNSLYQ